MPVAAKLAAKMPVAAKLPGGGKGWRQSLAAWRQSWDRGPPAAKLSRTRSATVQSVQFSSVSQSVSQSVSGCQMTQKPKSGAVVGGKVAAKCCAGGGINAGGGTAQAAKLPVAAHWRQSWRQRCRWRQSWRQQCRGRHGGKVAAK
eukprot:gene8885-biopygen6394